MLWCKGNFFYIQSFILGKTENFSHKPVWLLFSGCRRVLPLPQTATDRCLDSVRIPASYAGQFIFRLIAKLFFFTEVPAVIHVSASIHCIRDMNWWKIRIREITIILCIFFGTHCMGRFFVIIPATCFLDNALALFDQFNLTFSFSFNGIVQLP